MSCFIDGITLKLLVRIAFGGNLGVLDSEDKKQELLLELFLDTTDAMQRTVERSLWIGTFSSHDSVAHSSFK